MHSLAYFARIEIEVFIVALSLVVAFQLLTGKINLNGLLLEKTGYGPGRGPDNYSPARLQMLLMTFVAAFHLLTGVINNIHQGNLVFPELDQRILMLLGASHSLYLGGKVNSLFGLLGKSNGTSNSSKGD